MRNLLRCRRGSAAFATTVALVPLIGVVALGAEAGSWYVTKQQAQNAADAAAYSGALKRACELATQTGITCNDLYSVDYRGKEFAAQNAFCNTGDTSYPDSKCATSLPAGTSQNVQIAVNGNKIQATVSQQQPAYLAKILGLSTVNIAATAIAQVDSLIKPPCVLALKDAITFQGSATVSSSTCGISSDSSAADAIGFKGNTGIHLNAPSYTVGGCTQTGGSQCTNVQTYSKFIPDPLSALNAAVSSLKPSDFPDGACPSASGASPISLPPYGVPKKCYYVGNPFQNNKDYILNGVYFFAGANGASGAIKIQGGNSIKGSSVTLILLPAKFVNASDPGASLTITGNPTIQITAPSSVSTSQVPTKLTSVVGLMKGLLIYDPESGSNVNVTGNSSSYFNGTVYVPNAPVTYGGNSSASAPSSGCYQVIAYSVTFLGDTKLDNSSCPAGNPGAPQVWTVRLVRQ